MDIQLKRGMLDVCVLAAIKDEDSYGYQIIKDMKPYVTISEDLRRERCSRFIPWSTTEDSESIIILRMPEEPG